MKKLIITMLLTGSIPLIGIPREINRHQAKRELPKPYSAKKTVGSNYYPAKTHTSKKSISDTKKLKEKRAEFAGKSWSIFFNFLTIPYIIVKTSFDGYDSYQKAGYIVENAAKKHFETQDAQKKNTYGYGTYGYPLTDSEKMKKHDYFNLTSIYNLNSCISYAAYSNEYSYTQKYVRAKKISAQEIQNFIEQKVLKDTTKALLRNTIKGLGLSIYATILSVGTYCATNK